jgi:hypothetical protein
MPKKHRASRGKRSGKPSIRKTVVPVTRAPQSVTTPIAGPDAFRNPTAPEYVQSQAATLLLIGSRLRGDAAATQARTESQLLALGARAIPPAATTQPVPPEDLRAIQFPEMSLSPVRFRPAETQRMAGVRFSEAVSLAPRRSDVQTAITTLPSAADAFYQKGTAESAAALLETSLRHPDELVRVAAAASYSDVSTDPLSAIRILENGLRSRDRLTRDVAAYALAHVDPTNPDLNKLLGSKKRPSALRPSRTATIVHGTWARSGTWWQPPSGDFWKYIHDNVDASLYGASDRFEWTGGYSDAARSIAGQDLHQWITVHSLDGLDLYGHSHGANVAMLANQACSKVGKMVLLSCPVHWPKYMPDFTKVNKVVSVRVHLDLVILADRGGQKFSDPRIRENVLPVWFNHFATHDPAVWAKYNVPGML